MSEEKRFIGTYEIENSLFIGGREVVFGVDKTQVSSFMVCYCDYNNPMGVGLPAEAIGTDDYLEAMQEFTERVQKQIEQIRIEQERFKFDMTPFTIADCIPDDRGESIIGKVIVINADSRRYEYQHSAYQLVFVESGNGASGGRGQGVFGTRLADVHQGRWERYDVLGKIKPDRMPAWAERALIVIQSSKRHERLNSREV